MFISQATQGPNAWNRVRQNRVEHSSAQLNFGGTHQQFGLYLGFMEAFQQMMTGWGSFGGNKLGSPVGTPVKQNAPLTFTSPIQNGSSASPNSQIVKLNSQRVQETNTVDAVPVFGPVSEHFTNRLEQLQNHWVEILPEAFEGSAVTNSDGLSMRTVEGKSIPYAPGLLGHSPVLDINTKIPVAGKHGIDEYWEARTADGLDHSKLGKPLMGAPGDRYNEDVIRRLAIDGTASEIFPGDHLFDHMTPETERRDNLTFTYSALNSQTSVLHDDATAEEKQNLHEAGKFAIASATFLESEGSFDDAALDKFLAEQLDGAEPKSSANDGPRGERLAKLGEVTRAIVDGEVDIEDVVEHGIVPKDQVKKFEASVKTVKHGKIGADVSKVTNKTTDSEVRSTIAKSKTVGSFSNTAAKNVVKAKK